MRVRLVTLGVCIGLVLALAACGGGESESTPEPSTTAPAETGGTVAETTAETAAAEPGAPIGTFDGAELTLSRWAGDPWETATRDAGAQWDAATGAKIELDALPYENLRDTQVLQLSSGSGTYDILYVHPSWLGEYVDAGYLRPIDDFLADPSLNPDGFSTSQYVTSILEQGAVGGKQYCFQDFVATVLLAYRTDVFEANGIEPPETWDDILAAAEKLDGKDGMAGIALPGKRTGAVADVLSSLLIGTDTWYFDESGKAALDPQKAVAAIEFYANAAKYAPSGILNMHWDEAATAAAQGKAAMLITLSPTLAWLNDPSRSTTVGKWGYVPLAISADKPAGELVYWNWCIAADSKDPEAAYSFLQWFTGGQQQAAVAKASATAGSTTDFYENAQLAEELPFLPAMQAALENSLPQPSLADWPKAQDQVELAVQEAISGDKTPLEAAESMQAALAEVLGG